MYSGSYIRVLFVMALLVVLGTLLSMSVSMIKFASRDGLTPLAFLLSSSFIAGVLLQLVAILLGYRHRLNWHYLEYSVVTGFIFSLTNILSFFVVTKIGVSYLSILLSFPITLTWLLSIFLGMSKASFTHLLGTSLCVVGGIFLSFSANTGTGRLNIWTFIAFLIPVVIALGNIYRTKRWPELIHPIQLAASMLLFSCPVTGVVLVVGNNDWTLQLYRIFSEPRWVALQVTIYVFMYCLFFFVQKLSGPVYISFIGVIATLVGAATSIVILGEHAGVVFYLSFLFVLLGIFVFSLPRRNVVLTK
ncbi:DMT family transporter [Teredinibacter turnerae]|nr:DMT family transporter [Teredinibacter turnerae]